MSSAPKICFIESAAYAVLDGSIGGSSTGSESVQHTFASGVPYSEVNAYFERARVFLNTSDSEGFPNSFLQAWVRRVPVISYFDPDQVIAAKGLGVSVDTQNDFVAAISGLLGDEDERQEAGRRSRQFVVDRYSPDAIAVQYERLIAEQFGITIDGL